MTRFEKGDPVRADLPDKSDPDHERYHGRRGEVIEVVEDDAGLETGDERDSVIFRVRLDDGEVADFRWRDLRPVRNS
jgi:ribosomal protein L21E